MYFKGGRGMNGRGDFKDSFALSEIALTVPDSAS